MRQVNALDRQTLRRRQQSGAAAEQRIVDLADDLALQGKIAGDNQQSRPQSLIVKKFLLDAGHQGDRRHRRRIGDFDFPYLADLGGARGSRSRQNEKRQ